MFNTFIMIFKERFKKTAPLPISKNIFPIAFSNSNNITSTPIVLYFQSLFNIFLKIFIKKSLNIACPKITHIIHKVYFEFLYACAVCRRAVHCILSSRMRFCVFLIAYTQKRKSLFHLILFFRSRSRSASYFAFVANPPRIWRSALFSSKTFRTSSASD